MSESRQQRRARERAEAKAANRRGPAPRPEEHRRPHVLDVELSRFVDDEEPDYVTWAAEWGLRGGAMGIEADSEDLQEIVDAVLEEAETWTDQFDLRIEWTLGGDAPEGQTVEQAVAATGIKLPTAPS